MFERFTIPAREMVLAAQQEARSLGDHQVGTEHLLLALLADERGVAQATLRPAGIDRTRVLTEIQRQAGSAAGPQPPAARRLGLLRRRRPGRSRFTPQARRALELSLEESRRLRDKKLGPRHLLLGILRVGDGLAAKTIAGTGADLEDLIRKTRAAA